MRDKTGAEFGQMDGGAGESDPNPNASPENPTPSDPSPPKSHLKISSWNINGLRAQLRKGTLNEYLK